MKRIDITNLFPDATEEQISTLLGINGADISSAKAGADALRAQLAKAPDPDALQKAQKRAAALESELSALKASNQQREVREKVAKEKNVPASLLTGDTEEACNAQADALTAWRDGAAHAAPNSSVDHLLGGKPGNGGAPTDEAYKGLLDGLFPTE